jgi:hypothetical protein
LPDSLLLNDLAADAERHEQLLDGNGSKGAE